MTLEIPLRDVMPRATKVHIDASYHHDCDLDSIAFLWDEGNHACDCNRSRLLYGEAGSHHDYDGEPIHFVRVVVRAAGEVLCTPINCHDWEWCGQKPRPTNVSYPGSPWGDTHPCWTEAHSL